jgi:hypothetical protein
MQAFEAFVTAPTPFMIEHWPDLLPDWAIAPQSVVLILLRAQVSLAQEGLEIEEEKDRLLQEFWKIGEFFRQENCRQGYSSEIISPKDGLPYYSAPGTLRFDSVAAVNYALSFPYARTEYGCKVLTHPQWQQAVYPGLLLSNAPPTKLDLLLKGVNFKI